MTEACDFLLQGTTDIEQLALVIKILGTPNAKDWPEMESLPDFKKIQYAMITELENSIETNSCLFSFLFFSIVFPIAKVNAGKMYFPRVQRLKKLHLLMVL